MADGRIDESVVRMAWRELAPVHNALNADSGAIISDDPHFREVFDNPETKPTVLMCCDERLAGNRLVPFEKRRFRVASGAFDDVDNPQQRAKEVAAYCVETGVDIVSSHDGCAGAKLAALRDAKAGHIVDEHTYTQNPDLYGRLFARWVQDEINRVKQTSREPVHFPRSIMNPFGFHNALGVMVNYTTQPLNFHRLVRSIPFFGVESCRPADLRTAIKISFGTEGFGHHRFNIGMRRFVVAVMAPRTKMVDAVDEVRSVLKQDLDRKLIQRILVRGFEKPHDHRRKIAVKGRSTQASG